VAFAFGGVAALALEVPLARVAAFVALGLATLELHKARPTRSWLGAGAALLVLGSWLAATALLARPAYRFPPFATEPSAAALVVAVALVIVARFWRALLNATRTAMGGRPQWTYASALKVQVKAVTVAPWLWVFVWVLIELSMAFSASASMLLLVTYFAATAVGCVAAGRAKRAPRVRHVGLGLALVSAATAVYGASTYFDFAARIAAYLVTSAFLLGIAYWYRRPGATPRCPAWLPRALHLRALHLRALHLRALHLRALHLRALRRPTWHRRVCLLPPYPRPACQRLVCRPLRPWAASWRLPHCLPARRVVWRPASLAPSGARSRGALRRCPAEGRGP